MTKSTRDTLALFAIATFAILAVLYNDLNPGNVLLDLLARL
ncbi:hypothetical protein [Devosia epidermidihirudinis]|nr:hypothetical protein [Devosia epidermidihirudinis]